MTTNTPMARAVEAIRGELEGTGDWCFGGGCPQCDAEAVNLLRTALPALLEAVVGEMTGNPECVVLEGATGRHVMVLRTALLAALTDAAGRLP